MKTRTLLLALTLLFAGGMAACTQTTASTAQDDSLEGWTYDYSGAYPELRDLPPPAVPEPERPALGADW